MRFFSLFIDTPMVAADPGSALAGLPPRAARMEVAQMRDDRSLYEMVNGVPVVAAPEEIDVTNAPDLRSALRVAASARDRCPSSRSPISGSGDRVEASAPRPVDDATEAGPRHPFSLHSRRARG